MKINGSKVMFIYFSLLKYHVQHFIYHTAFIYVD